MAMIYDQIGRGYNDYRRADPRIAAAIFKEIGEAGRIINIGAGSGAYEPAGYQVIALEPSRAMLSQRPENKAQAIQGLAEFLPFRDHVFDIGLAILTLHHWSDIAQGLREALRVIKHRLILLTWIGFQENFWLLDYFPQIKTIDEALFPSIEQLTEILGPIRVVPILIPHDCTDGFLCAYWRRPRAYLDEGVRSAISTFARVRDVETGLKHLKHDLESGRWHAKHRDLLDKENMDFGYRLVVWDQRSE